jgi:hypothetical protein
MITGIARAGVAIATLTLVMTFAEPATAQVDAQAPIDVYELADYRLTTEVFERFVQASRQIAEITQRDDSFTHAPLFTKEVALSGDAVAEVAGLMARLTNHAALAAALEDAKITPREYSKFVITLVAAHLAHGFLNAGVLTQVPSGAPTTNVAFVKARESDVNAALADLGIRD